jgi:hypothetical protein
MRMNMAARIGLQASILTALPWMSFMVSGPTDGRPDDAAAESKALIFASS